MGVPYDAELIIEVFALQLLLAFTITAFGVMVAARITQMQSFMALMQMLIMPLFFLSGAMFPASNLPGWLTVLNRIDPLTYAVDPMRRIIFAHLDIAPRAQPSLNSGVTWNGWRVPTMLEVGIIAVMGLVMLAIAIWEFATATDPRSLRERPGAPHEAPTIRADPDRMIKRRIAAAALQFYTRVQMIVIGR